MRATGAAAGLAACELRSPAAVSSSAPCRMKARRPKRLHVPSWFTRAASLGDAGPSIRIHGRFRHALTGPPGRIGRAHLGALPPGTVASGLWPDVEGGRPATRKKTRKRRWFETTQPAHPPNMSTALIPQYAPFPTCPSVVISIHADPVPICRNGESPL